VPNDDGTVSFLPSADIFLAALVILLVLVAALAAWLFRSGSRSRREGAGRRAG